MNDERKTWKDRLRGFSDEVFRNYLIMRVRWTISSLERRRNSDIKDLGNRIYRLIQQKKLEIPEVKTMVKDIQDLESKIQVHEERLREIIMSAEVPKQLPDPGTPEPAVPKKREIIDATAEKPVAPAMDGDIEKKLKAMETAAQKPVPAAPRAEKEAVKPLEKPAEKTVEKPEDKAAGTPVAGPEKKADVKPVETKDEKKASQNGKNDIKNNAVASKPESKGKGKGGK